MIISRNSWLITVLLVLVLSSPTFAQPEARKPLKVLFIGNSYTFYNKLPRMVGELAKAAGERPLVYEEETPGGWSFKKHWESGKAVEKIREKKWDVVILQNHSLGALQARKDMFFYGRKLKEAIDKQGAKTLLYMTWARQNKPETQKEIASAYVQLGKELGAEVAPVGLAWQKVLQTKDKIALHIQDKSHPTKAGSYLAACVIYARLYHKSPVGLPGSIGGLPDSLARELQKSAWKIAGK